MKKTAFFLLLIYPMFFSGQDYKLLTATSKKLYSTVLQPQIAYSLSIESASMIGTDSVYYNFFELDDEWTESDTCYFWGGPYCNKQNRPGWLGPRIEFDNQFSYLFFNQGNDTLHFSFNTEVDGPIPFYNDSIQKFSILYEKNDTLTLLGQTDSVRYFKIIHSDLDGNPIDSPLNDYDLIISKQFGLASFFVINSFPSVIKPLQLIGNINPNAGFYEITNEMVYDHQPGDEIQFNEYQHYETGVNPPWYNFNRYRIWSFLDRQETADSLIYTAKQKVFYVDSVGLVTDTVTLKYLRSGIIAQIPFEKFNGSHRQLDNIEYCDNVLWSYTTRATEDIAYCEEDTCWGTIDLGRPPEETYKSIVCGLGVYDEKVYVVGPDGYSKRNRIVYFKNDSIICGDQIYVDVNQQLMPKDKVQIFPNPADNYFQITSPVKMKKIIVFNMIGNKIFSTLTNGNQVTIDLHQLNEGLYFVNIYLNENRFLTKKIIILHH